MPYALLHSKVHQKSTAVKKSSENFIQLFCQQINKDINAGPFIIASTSKNMSHFVLEADVEAWHIKHI